MKDRHKEYVCQRTGCNRSFRKSKYLEHLKVCLGTFHAYSIGKIEAGNLTKTWRCSAFGCEAKFKTKKMCDLHTEKCTIDLHRPLPNLKGYPGNSDDEEDDEPEQVSRWKNKVLFTAIRVEYLDKLKKLEREANQKSKVRQTESETQVTPETRSVKVQTA
jgi:hypothetical protein